MKLTIKEARRLMLFHHGLLQKTPYKGKSGIMTFIRKVGCIQFDPLNIIAMNPHLVLQSRIAGYRKHLLEELLYQDRLLLDGWDKNMSIFPTEEMPYFRRYYDTAIIRHTWRDPSIVKHMPEIRQHIQQHGPVTSKDLALDHKIDWAWAPTSAARALLDLMFFTGELIIYDKLGSRKQYDLASRHLDAALLEAEDPNPELTDYHQWGMLRRINAVGILWDKRSEALLGIRDMKTKERLQALAQLESKGKILSFTIEGLDNTFYTTPDILATLPEVMKRYHRRVHFIAPLDSLIWDRPMIEQLFNFKYKWEVYTPKEQRVYGYYVLPVLFGDQFIGRIEPRFDKKTKTLILHNLWLERKVDHFEKPFNDAIDDFMAFLGAEHLQIDLFSETASLMQSLITHKIHG